MSRLKDWLWNLWLPPWEGENNRWLKFRATVMYYVRSVWYLGREERCHCTNCKTMVPKASASWLCHTCLTEDCDCEAGYEWRPSC